MAEKESNNEKNWRLKISLDCLFKVTVSREGPEIVAKGPKDCQPGFIFFIVSNIVDCVRIFYINILRPKETLQQISTIFHEFHDKWPHFCRHEKTSKTLNCLIKLFIFYILFKERK